jgi:PadR family transcriptional regulator, regulatory protein PadR
MTAAPAYLGEFEQLVLLAVLRLGHGAYAVPIRQAIEEAAARSVSRGALYTTLERLEAKGLLSSSMGEQTAERGGRARRYHAVTPAGLRALRAARDAVGRLSIGLDSVLGRSR